MRYLYNKLCSSKEDIVTLLPSLEDLAFMTKNGITFKEVPHSDGLVTVNRRDFAQFFRLIELSA